MEDPRISAMAWIQIKPENETVAVLLAGVTPRGVEPDEILSVHGPKVEGLAAHLALYKSAMRPTKSLPALERELIAVVVSDLNACHY